MKRVGKDMTQMSIVSGLSYIGTFILSCLFIIDNLRDSGELYLYDWHNTGKNHGYRPYYEPRSGPGTPGTAAV